MGKTTKRSKRHSALAGIPQRIIDLSPREWPDAKRGQWCRAYLAGAKAPHLAGAPREMRQLSGAFRMGQKSAGAMEAELAQVAETRRINAERAHAHEERRERMVDARRSSLLGQLDLLGGGGLGGGGLGGDAERIVGMAASSLGLAGVIGAGMTGGRR